MGISVGGVLKLLALGLLGFGLYWTGWWQDAVIFLWQFPLISWLPIVVWIVAGLIWGTVGGLVSGRSTAAAAAPSPAPEEDLSPAAGGRLTGKLRGSTGVRGSELVRFSGGPGFLTGLAVLLIGIGIQIFSPPVIPLDRISYGAITDLPARTQPRLLPRSAVDDDPRFADAEEIHLVRDIQTGELTYTGEWQASTLSGPSQGVVVQALDDVTSDSVILPAGFDHSVSGFGPGTFIWRAKQMHPLSRIQYPVIVPLSETEAIAVAPYVGYEGWPLRTPYLKGVLVYHQDGTIEDLTPAEAAARPELVRSGRIVPETVARKEAEALARSLDGEIVDADDNRQPYLTAIDENTTVWLTVVNGEGPRAGVVALVLTDSSTGETGLWEPSEGEELVSTQQVINLARALPLQWEETRCCDSEGHSYTVTLREVVEPRLAFKDDHPYYLVSVVPTDELVIARQIERTLLVDAETGDVIQDVDHVIGGGAADEKLQNFFEAG